MPNLHEFDFESIAERVSHEINGMKTNTQKVNHLTDSSFRVIDYLFFVILCVGVMSGIIYFYRKRQVHIFKPDNDNKFEELPLETQSIPDTQKSDIHKNRGFKKSRFYNPKPTLLITALIMILTIQTDAKVQEDIIVITFRYESPCVYLTKRNFTLFEISWCDQKFNETFIEPIERFCVTHAKVININRLLFHNKAKRDLHFSSLDPTKTSMPVPAIAHEWKNLDMASMAASFMMIKSTLTNMGTKWLKGEIDEQFITSPYINLQLPNDHLISNYAPQSCLLDKTCKYLILELRLKRGISPVSNITGWSNSEDYLSLLIIALIIILLLLIRKIRSVIRQRQRAYKIIFASERRTSPPNEGSLMEPPPYPRVEGV
jgi:hypothetical protein